MFSATSEEPLRGRLKIKLQSFSTLLNKNILKENKEQPTNNITSSDLGFRQKNTIYDLLVRMPSTCDDRYLPYVWGSEAVLGNLPASLISNQQKRTGELTENVPLCWCHYIQTRQRFPAVPRIKGRRESNLS